MSASQKVGGIRIIPDTDLGSVNTVDFADKQNDHSIGLAAPDNLTASTVFRLPPSDGSAGDVIATNGSGGWRFISVAAAVAGEAPGDDTEVIFNSSGHFATSPHFIYNPESRILVVGGVRSDGAGMVTQLFNSYAVGDEVAITQADGTFYIQGDGQAFFQTVFVHNGYVLGDIQTSGHLWSISSENDILNINCSFAPGGPTDVVSVNYWGQITSNAPDGLNAFSTYSNVFRVTGDGNTYVKSITALENAYVVDLVIRDTTLQTNTWQLYSTGGKFMLYAGFGVMDNIYSTDAINGYTTWFYGVQINSVLNVSGDANFGTVYASHGYVIRDIQNPDRMWSLASVNDVFTLNCNFAPGGPTNVVTVSYWGQITSHALPGLIAFQTEDNSFSVHGDGNTYVKNLTSLQNVYVVDLVIRDATDETKQWQLLSQDGVFKIYAGFNATGNLFTIDSISGFTVVYGSLKVLGELIVVGDVTFGTVYATHGFVVKDIQNPSHMWSLASVNDVFTLNCNFAPGGAKDVVTVSYWGAVTSNALPGLIAFQTADNSFSVHGDGNTYVKNLTSLQNIYVVDLVIRDATIDTNQWQLLSQDGVFKIYAGFNATKNLLTIDSISGFTVVYGSLQVNGELIVVGDVTFGTVYATHGFVVKDVQTPTHLWSMASVNDIFSLNCNFSPGGAKDVVTVNATGNVTATMFTASASLASGLNAFQTANTFFRVTGDGNTYVVSLTASANVYCTDLVIRDTDTPANTWQLLSQANIFRIYAGFNATTYLLKIDSISGFSTFFGSVQARTFIADYPAGNGKGLSVASSGSPRWFMGGNNDGEAGNNSGTNFVISRISDAGVQIDSPIAINRATGLVTIPSLSLAGGNFTGGTVFLSNGLVIYDVQTPSHSWSLASLSDIFRLNCNFTPGGAYDVIKVNANGSMLIGPLSTFVSNLEVAPISTTSGIKTGTLELQSINTNFCNVMANAYFNGSQYLYRETGYATLFQSSSGSFVFYVAASGNAGTAVSWVNAMLIAANGTVTIPNLSLGAGGSLTAGAVFLNNGLVINDVQTPTHQWSLASTQDVFRLNCNFTSGGAQDVIKVDNAGKTTIGITAVSPIAQLYVVSPANSTSAAFTDAANSTLNIMHASSPLNNSLIYATFGTAAQIWRVNSIDAMCLTNGGKLGIGTVAPVSPLEVVGVAGTSSIKTGSLEIQSSALSWSNVMDNAYYTGSQYLRRGTGAASMIQQTSGSIVLYTAATGAAGTAVTWILGLQVSSTTGQVTIPNLSLAGGSYTFGTVFLNNGLVINDVQTPAHSWSLASTSDIFRLNCNFTPSGAADVFFVNSIGGFQFGRAATSQMRGGLNNGGGTNIAFWYDSTPTYACHIGNCLASSAPLPDLVFSMYASSAWTERMRLTNAGRLGIWSAAPRSQLSVNSVATATTPGMSQVTIGEGSNNSSYSLSLGFILDTDGYWKGVVQTYEPSGLSYLLLNPSGGRVGIGTLAPVSQFEVVNPAGNSGLKVGSIEFQTFTPSYTNVLSNAYLNGTNWVYRAAGWAGLMQMNSGNIYFYLAPSGSAGVTVPWVLCMAMTTTSITIPGSVACGTMFLNNGLVIRDVQTPANQYSLASTLNIFRLNCNFSSGGATDVITVDSTGQVGLVGNLFVNQSQGATIRCVMGADPAASPANVSYAGMFYETGSNALWIDAITQSVAWRNVCICPRNTGNVGIGNSAPVYRLDVTGDIRASGEIIGAKAASGAGGQFRLTSGGTSAGVMLYTDGSAFYFLLSATPYGGYNTLRPFYFSLTSGTVYMGSGLQVSGGGVAITGGGLSVTGEITGTASLTLSANVYTYDLVLRDNGNSANAFQVLSTNSVFRIFAGVGVGADVVNIAASSGYMTILYSLQINGSTLNASNTTANFGPIYTSNGLVCKDVNTPTRNYSLASTGSVFSITANFGVAGAGQYFYVDAGTGAVCALYFFKCGNNTGVSAETVATSGGTRWIRGGIICAT